MIIDISSLIPGIAFVPYILFTIFGLNQRKREGIRLSFIFYMSLMAIWSFGSFMMHADTGLITPLFWNRFMVTGLLGGPITIFHSFLELSQTQKKRNNIILYLGYLIYAFLLYLNFTGRVVSDAGFRNGRFYYTLADGAFVAYVLSYSYLIFGIYLLMREIARSSDMYLRRKLKLPLIGAIIMLMGVLANLYEPLGRYPIDLFAATVNAFFIFYAVYKYRLVNYSAFVVRSILYFILVTISSFAFYIVFYWIFPPLRSIPMDRAILPFFLLGIIAAVIFQPLRNSTLSLMEKIYFGERFKYYQNLGGFLEDLTTIVELEVLSTVTLKRIVDIFDIEWAMMLVLDYSTRNYRISAQTGLEIDARTEKRFRIPRNSPFIGMIAHAQGPLLNQNSEITSNLNIDGYVLVPSLVMPLHFKERTNGCLLLGRRRQKEFYDQFDIEMIEILASQSSMALENAISFERLHRQQKRLQELNRELIISKNKLEAFFDGITTPISIQDINYNIITINFSGARYCGRTYEELVGKKCYQVFFNRNKPCESCMAQDCLHMQIPFRSELTDEKTGSTFDVHFYPISVPDESQKIFLEFFQDISQQKKLQEELAQSEKLAGIGTLASGIAHEINNPLTGIIGTAELLKDEIEEGTEQREFVEDIITYAQNAAEVISELKLYTHKEKHKTEDVHIADIIDTSLKLAGRGMQMGNIDVEKRFSDDIVIQADPVELQQVFLNILINAVQAMEGRGRLTITSRISDQQGIISIADTGRGISTQHIDKIFNPFFTTKGPRTGTGLGLSITHQIVAKMGGRILVESTPNQGTEFILYFPLSADEVRRIRFVHATTPSRLEDVFYIQRKILVGEKGYLAETIHRSIDEKAFHILAYRGLQPVGTVSCITSEMTGTLPIEDHFRLNGEKDSKRCVEIDRLAVVHEERGSIIPLGLMTLSYLYAKSQDIEKLFLDVFSDEKKYIAMYHKLGFHVLGEYRAPLPVTVMSLDYMTDYEKKKARMEQFVKPFMKRLVQHLDFEESEREIILQAVQKVTSSQARTV
jgi:PAS domain S-box-containing protein